MTAENKKTERTQAPERRTPGSLGAKSLIFKVLVRFLPLALAAALLLMLLAWHFTRRDLLADIDTEVGIFATATCRVLDGLLWNFHTEEMVSALGAISSHTAILGAEVYDENGKLFLAYGITPEDRVGGLLTVWRDIYRRQPDGSRADMGKLAIHYTYTFAEERLKLALLRDMALVTLIIVLTFAGAAYAFNRAVNRPLKALRKAIQTTTETGRRTEAEWRSDDEIGEVVQAHNDMLERLADRNAAVIKSEKIYRQLFENAQVGIYVTNSNGVILGANKTLVAILGYESINELPEIDVSSHYVDPDDRVRLWTRLGETGEISRFRLRLRRVGGGLIWAEMSGRITPDGTFNGILQDITDRVEAERAMEERDELYRAFFEENKAAMILHDPLNLSIQFANPAACRFYGYSNAEMTSMTMREVDCMTDAQVYQELKEATEERRNYFKHVHTLKDGTRRHVEVFTGPVSLGRRQLHYSIVHDVTDKRRLEARLQRMATRDQLTGSYNRHAFFQRAKNELARARRFSHPLSVLMCDLDFFKEINDTYGHAVGDEVLRAFALRCRADFRQNDIFARLGGEEFAALLVETDAGQAMTVAERIRATAAAMVIPTDAGDLTVTVSIGVAALCASDSVNDLLKRADDALYEAKKSGRNTVAGR